MKRNYYLYLFLPFLLSLFSCSGLIDNKVELEKIYVKKEPTKTKYFLGDVFDPSGLVIMAKYSNYKEKDVTSNVDFKGFDSSKKDSYQRITVTYTDNDITKTTYFYISISELDIPIKYEITYKNVKKWIDSIGITWIQVITEITNTGKSPIYLSSGSYEIEDTSGSIIQVENYISIKPTIIQENEKAYFYDETIMDMPTSDIGNFIPHFTAKKATSIPPKINITDINIVESTLGIKALGRIKNLSDSDITTFIYIAIVLFDENNKPIGVLSDSLSDDLLIDSTLAFEATNLYLDNIVTKESIFSYKAYAYPLTIQF